MMHQVGRTQKTGFQIGVRRTLPAPLEAVWRLITSPEGAEIWLGAGADLEFVQGERYRLEDGTQGEVRVVSGSHLRITWQPGGWPRPSTIQVRVIAKGTDRTVVAFHQEHLPGPPDREARSDHFAAALDRLENLSRRG